MPLTLERHRSKEGGTLLQGVSFFVFYMAYNETQNKMKKGAKYYETIF
jgi:hypothetical protein